MKQQFLISEVSRKISKTYGGSTYTLNIYENKGVGKVNLIGSVTACTRGHKGEDSEAWEQILRLNALKPSILKEITAAANDPANRNYNFLGYYSFRIEEKFGVDLKML